MPVGCMRGGCAPATAPDYPSANELPWDVDFSQFALLEPPVTVAIPADDGGRFELSLSSPVVVSRLRADGTSVWSVRPSGRSARTRLDRADCDSGTMLVDDARLFVVEYLFHMTSAMVTALNADTGGELWRTTVQGLGEITHSLYTNRVIARMVRGALVLYGKESAGRYIEVYAPTGERLSHRLLPIVHEDRKR
jgi:outer membrane protein assembly factor BamB